MVKASGAQSRKKKTQLSIVSHKLSQSMAKFITVNPRPNKKNNPTTQVSSDIIILDDSQSSLINVGPNSQKNTDVNVISQNIDTVQVISQSEFCPELVLHDSESSQSVNGLEWSSVQQSSSAVEESENSPKNVATGTEIFSQTADDNFDMSQDDVESGSEMNRQIPSQVEANPSTSSPGTESFCQIWDDDFADPGKWPKIMTPKIKSLIVFSGPHQIKNVEFPKDNNGRKFTTKMYYTENKNGETENRKWLVYSKEKNSVFCFPCKLFLPGKFQLAGEYGYSDWRNLSKTLKEHEISKGHKESIINWCDYQSRSKSGQTIEELNIKRIHSEVSRWKSVFERLMGITKYLGQHNLAFRGARDTLKSDNNGNFLGLVELLAQFDSVLSEHVNLVTSKQISDHYLSKSIQNELIQVISKATQDRILDLCRNAKYYSIIVDCTRDISRIEQMTLSIRFVQVTKEKVSVDEHFLCFVKAELSTGEGLTENIMDLLVKFGLDLDNCRGQGYDNGSNMAGKNKGVQKRILELNSRAFFLPCSAHKLNLVMLDAAQSCVMSTTFFGTIQAIYVFFSASTSRWSILMKHLPTFTLKPLSETRWEAKVQSVKAFKFQMGEIYDALLDIFNSTSDQDTKFQAQNFAKLIKSYPFIISTAVWYEILFRVNLVSKKLQSPALELDTALKEIEKLINFFQEFKESGFSECKEAVKSVAEDLEINQTFDDSIKLRTRRAKRFFGEQAESTPVRSPEEKYKEEFFEAIVDTCLKSMPRIPDY